MFNSWHKRCQSMSTLENDSLMRCTLRHHEKPMLHSSLQGKITFPPACPSVCVGHQRLVEKTKKNMPLPVKRLDVSFWPQGPKSSDLTNTLLKGNMFFSQHRISRKSAFTWCLQDIFIHVKFIIFQAHLKSCQQTPNSRNLWHDPLKSPWTFQVWVTFQLPQVPLESMAQKKIRFHWFLGEWLCRSFWEIIPFGFPKGKIFWFFPSDYDSGICQIEFPSKPPSVSVSSKPECLTKLCVLPKQEKTQSGTQAKLICEFKRTSFKKPSVLRNCRHM